MRLVFVLALTACASHTAIQGECGTQRADIAWAGELLTRCDAGDFLACERAKERCDGGTRYFCAEAPPKSTATLPELRARFEVSCKAGKAEACRDEAELATRAGDDPEPFYVRACDWGDSQACWQLGSLFWARGKAADQAGDWKEAGRLFRLACFKHNVSEACSALEYLRADAKHYAIECEAGRDDVCERAAITLHATSQGPADDTRADAIRRKISH
jgi:hypothetical protein